MNNNFLKFLISGIFLCVNTFTYGQDNNENKFDGIDIVYNTTTNTLDSIPTKGFIVDGTTLYVPENTESLSGTFKFSPPLGGKVNVWVSEAFFKDADNHMTAFNMQNSYGYKLDCLRKDVIITIPIPIPILSDTIYKTVTIRKSKWEIDIKSRLDTLNTINPDSTYRITAENKGNRVVNTRLESDILDKLSTNIDSDSVQILAGESFDFDFEMPLDSMQRNTITTSLKIIASADGWKDGETKIYEFKIIKPSSLDLIRSWFKDNSIYILCFVLGILLVVMVQRVRPLWNRYIKRKQDNSDVNNIAPVSIAEEVTVSTELGEKYKKFLEIIKDISSLSECKAIIDNKENKTVTEEEIKAVFTSLKNIFVFLDQIEGKYNIVEAYGYKSTNGYTNLDPHSFSKIKSGTFTLDDESLVKAMVELYVAILKTQGTESKSIINCQEAIAKRYSIKLDAIASSLKDFTKIIDSKLEVINDDYNIDTQKFESIKTTLNEHLKKSNGYDILLKFTNEVASVIYPDKSNKATNGINEIKDKLGDIINKLKDLIESSKNATSVDYEVLIASLDKLTEKLGFPDDIHLVYIDEEDNQYKVNEKAFRNIDTVLSDLYYEASTTENMNIQEIVKCLREKTETFFSWLYNTLEIEDESNILNSEDEAREHISNLVLNNQNQIEIISRLENEITNLKRDEINKVIDSAKAFSLSIKSSVDNLKSDSNIAQRIVRSMMRENVLDVFGSTINNLYQQQNSDVTLINNDVKEYLMSIISTSEFNSFMKIYLYSNTFINSDLSDDGLDIECINEAYNRLSYILNLYDIEILYPQLFIGKYNDLHVQFVNSQADILVLYPNRRDVLESISREMGIRRLIIDIEEVGVKTNGKLDRKAKVSAL